MSFFNTRFKPFQNGRLISQENYLKRISNLFFHLLKNDYKYYLNNISNLFFIHQKMTRNYLKRISNLFGSILISLITLLGPTTVIPNLSLAIAFNNLSFIFSKIFSALKESR